MDVAEIYCREAAHDIDYRGAHHCWAALDNGASGHLERILVGGEATRESVGKEDIEQHSTAAVAVVTMAFMLLLARWLSPCPLCGRRMCASCLVRFANPKQAIPNRNGSVANPPPNLGCSKLNGSVVFAFRAEQQSSYIS